MLCTYSQLTGNLRCVNDITGQEYINCNAYSGRGLGFNNPDFQYRSGDAPRGLLLAGSPADAGPIPRGDYIVGYPVSSAHKRPPVLPLLPTPYDNTYGRHDFEIHGDNPSQNNSASEGCVIANKKCRAAVHSGELLRVNW